MKFFFRLVGKAKRTQYDRGRHLTRDPQDDCALRLRRGLKGKFARQDQLYEKGEMDGGHVFARIGNGRMRVRRLRGPRQLLAGALKMVRRNAKEGGGLNDKEVIKRGMQVTYFALSAVH
jgi:hypothetical protein